MTLSQLAQLPKNQIHVIDKANERSEPLKWYNLITIIHGKQSLTVRRSTAYNHGLCLGAYGLPVQHQKSELKESPGRKNPKLHEVTIKVSDEILKEFGGLRRLQKWIIVKVQSKI